MTQLPATADVERMIAAAAEGYAVIRERMTTDYSLEWLETALKDSLRKGLIEQLKVIDAADRGDEIAHRALVCVFAEMQTPPAQLKAYVERAALYGKGRKAGRNPYSNWRRDIGLVVLIYCVAKQFDLNPTRQLESRHPLPPSGAPGHSHQFPRIDGNDSPVKMRQIISRFLIKPGAPPKWKSVCGTATFALLASFEIARPSKIESRSKIFRPESGPAPTSGRGARVKFRGTSKAARSNRRLHPL
jgi:hypothetical protein